MRPLTVHDDLELERVGYERGEQLHPRGTTPGRQDVARHCYRVDVTSPLVVEGRVLLEQSVVQPAFGQAGGAPVYRFLDAAGVALTVRDLRRFRILVETTP